MPFPMTLRRGGAPRTGVDAWQALVREEIYGDVPQDDDPVIRTAWLLETYQLEVMSGGQAYFFLSDWGISPSELAEAFRAVGQHRLAERMDEAAAVLAPGAVTAVDLDEEDPGFADLDFDAMDEAWIGPDPMAPEGDLDARIVAFLEAHEAKFVAWVD